jgi:hypothetical protein
MPPQCRELGRLRGLSQTSLEALQLVAGEGLHSECMPTRDGARLTVPVPCRDRRAEMGRQARGVVRSLRPGLAIMTTSAALKGFGWWPMARHPSKRRRTCVPIICHTAVRSLTVMLSAPGDVFPVRRVASCASSREISCGNGIVLRGLTSIQGSWISSSAVRRSRVARRSALALSSWVS